MSEQAAIDNSPEPRTRESLARNLRAIGVEPGMTLLVHSSLSSLGWDAVVPSPSYRRSWTW